MARRLAHVVNVVLLVALFVGSVGVFDELPARIPSHFGPAGVPDAYWSTTMARWLLLPFIALGSTALLYGCAWVVGQGSSVMNVPDPARYRALAAPDRAEVVAMVRQYVYWTAAAMVGLLIILQYAVYLGYISVPGLIGVALVVVGILLGAFWLHRAVGRRVDVLYERARRGAGRSE